MLIPIGLSATALLSLLSMSSMLAEVSGHGIYAGRRTAVTYRVIGLLGAGHDCCCRLSNLW